MRIQIHNTATKAWITHLDFAIKMTDVADDGVVLHLQEVLSYDDVLAAWKKKIIKDFYPRPAA